MTDEFRYVKHKAGSDAIVVEQGGAYKTIPRESVASLVRLLDDHYPKEVEKVFEVIDE